MKNLIKFIIPILALFGTSAQGQVVLQNFSSVVNPPYTVFYGSWEQIGDVGGSVSPNAHFIQGTGVFDITGSSVIVPTNSADSSVAFFNAAPVSIGSNTFLAVTAQTLAPDIASSFTVFLVDGLGHSAYAAFGTAAFPTGSYTTFYGALTFNSGFDSANINEMIISGAQPVGTDRFNVSFDNISATAVPEPGTYAALTGLIALGFAVWRRRAVRTS